MKQNYIVHILLGLALVVMINVISSFWYGKIDMTEEQRFTLTEPTKETIRGLEKNVFVRIYLTGDLPASFKRLKKAAREMIGRMEALNPSSIEYVFTDPSEGTTKEVNKFRRLMSDKGIYPIEISVMKNNEHVQKLIYPYAEFTVDDRSQFINILEPQGGGNGQEEVLNNSVNLLEYKFAKAFQNTYVNIEPIVMFSQGHGEYPPLKVASVKNALEKSYRTGFLNMDSIFHISDKVDVLIIARPLKPFSEKKKFMIDQYVMNGGKIIWLIDKLYITLDSMRGNEVFYPKVIDLNLSDLFFRYGFRVNDNVILDLNCSKIPLSTGMQGNRPQIRLFDWYYHPVIVPSGKSEITKSLGPVNLKAPSTFDTIKTEYNVKKTPFLFTSEYSRIQRFPFGMSFKMLRYDPNLSLYDNGPYPTALLLEGEFSSLYQNRISKSMEEGLEELDMEFKPKSSPTRMLLVTDGNIIENEVNPATDEYRMAGYNKYNRTLYANQQFLLNAVEYLINPDGIFKARNRDIKIRLLNTIKAYNEKTYWQVLNIGTPLLVLIVFGLIFRFLRKRKYSVKL